MSHASTLRAGRARLSIVIVNWNSGELLRNCLRSIGAAALSGVELERVVVVDNASTDGSLREVECFGLPLALAWNNRNRGFAAACNQGACLTSSDYLLFLNPDTELFADSLSVPLAFMEQPTSRHIGICGIKLINKTGAVSRHCARFPTATTWIAEATGLSRLFPWLKLGHLMSEWDHLTSRGVPQVIGAFFLIRRSVFDVLGGFDERYFVYFEEVDFALRAAKKGWTTFYLADTAAFHAGGGTSRQVKAERLFYSLRSRLLYAFKHYSPPAAWLVLATTLVLEPVTRTVLALARGTLADVPHIARGYRILLAHLPSLLGITCGCVRSESTAAGRADQPSKAGDSK